MSKFKVGDKVRRVSCVDSWHIAASGAVVTVKEIDGCFIVVEEDSEGCAWDEYYFELAEPAKAFPKLRWLQVEYVRNSDHSMSGLNRIITAPVLQYFDGSDWQNVETVLETRNESV